MEYLRKLIEEAGIAGAGGAGFPAHMKLSDRADTVIVNGAECEPLLRVDQQLMAKRAGDLAAGLDMMVRAMGAERGIIALKGKYREAAAALETVVSGYRELSVFEMKNFYPAGDEQVMVCDVTGRIVPEGDIPLAVGCVVNNVETVLNIYDAAASGLCVTDKWITVTGAVRRPCTVKVPVGITAAEALELAGGAETDRYRIVNGGPMMGKLMAPGDVITKTTKGFIVLPEHHRLLKSLDRDIGSVLREAKTACMHCNQCTDVCPRNMLGHRLDPARLMRIASYGSLCDTTASITGAYLCVECRLCEYGCVHDLQPWRVNRMLKEQLRDAGIPADHRNVPDHVHPFREYRRFPVSKLVRMLGLTRYDRPAPIAGAYCDFARVTLLMKQHAGVPSEPVVKTGDRVEKGDLVGRIPEGRMGTNIHASISGRVTAADKDKVVIER